MALRSDGADQSASALRPCALSEGFQEGFLMCRRLRLSHTLRGRRSPLTQSVRAAPRAARTGTNSMGAGASVNETTFDELVYEASRPVDASDVDGSSEAARSEISRCRRVAAELVRQLSAASVDSFSVGHYNVLAGYLGNNYEPYVLLLLFAASFSLLYVFATLTQPGGASFLTQVVSPRSDTSCRRFCAVHDPGKIRPAG